MKILIIHHSGLLGGAGVSLLNVAKILKDEGHEVIISIPSEPNDMLKKADEMGLKTIVSDRRIGAITYVSGIDKAFSPRFIYRLMLILKQKKKWNSLIKEINPDVVVVNSKTLAWMSSLKEVKKRKSICFVRETMRRNKNNLINRHIKKRLEGFTKVSFISNYDLKLENLKIAKSFVIYDHLEDFKECDKNILIEKKVEWGLQNNTFKVLFVGGINYLKGAKIAVESVLKMGEGVELLVAGANFEDVKRVGNKSQIEYANNLEEFIKENDKFNQIRIIGKQSQMAYCYSLCDAVIFPMQAPHQARPVFEAGYFKKPIVISNFENVKEFVKDGENGFTAVYNDSDDFAEKLSVLKEDRVLLAKMGEINYQNAIKNHLEEVALKNIKKMFCEV